MVEAPPVASAARPRRRRGRGRALPRRASSPLPPDYGKDDTVGGPAARRSGREPPQCRRPRPAARWAAPAPLRRLFTPVFTPCRSELWPRCVPAGCAVQARRDRWQRCGVRKVCGDERRGAGRKVRGGRRRAAAVAVLGQGAAAVGSRCSVSIPI
eukprot:scaffold17789_cov112-Isochrysis_galbana.AAC.3